MYLELLLAVGVLATFAVVYRMKRTQQRRSFMVAGVVFLENADNTVDGVELIEHTGSQPKNTPVWRNDDPKTRIAEVAIVGGFTRARDIVNTASAPVSAVKPENGDRVMFVPGAPFRVLWTFGNTEFVARAHAGDVGFWVTFQFDTPGEVVVETMEKTDEIPEIPSSSAPIEIHQLADIKRSKRFHVKIGVPASITHTDLVTHINQRQSLFFVQQTTPDVTSATTTTTFKAPSTYTVTTETRVVLMQKDGTQLSAPTTTVATLSDTEHLALILVLIVLVILFLTKWRKK